jgi:hypothetical protein
MSTFTILAGFALMLFLPCIVAYFSYRDPARKTGAVAEYDSILDPIVSTQIASQAEPAEENAAEQPVLDIPKRSSKTAEPAGKPTEMISPAIVPHPAHKPQQAHQSPQSHEARIQRSEMEALIANAAAARAQAHALAANARLAVAKADAADAAATAAEAAAAVALNQVLRAA